MAAAAQRQARPRRSGEHENAPEEQRRADRSAFTRFKFEWLNQIAADGELPPNACRVAVRLAHYHDRDKGYAWPGIERLAGELGIKSPNTVRAAVKALEKRGHLAVEWSAGGPKQTHRFVPILAGQPFKLLKGYDGANPSSSEALTLQNAVSQPLKNLKGTPSIEPSDKHPAYGRGNVGENTSGKGARAQRATSRLSYVIDETIDVPDLGPCLVEKISHNEQCLTVRSETDGATYRVLISVTGRLCVDAELHEFDDE